VVGRMGLLVWLCDGSEVALFGLGRNIRTIPLHGLGICVMTVNEWYVLAPNQLCIFSTNILLSQIGQRVSFNRNITIAPEQRL
jgi:hypothetical protein